MQEIACSKLENRSHSMHLCACCTGPASTQLDAVLQFAAAGAPDGCVDMYFAHMGLAEHGMINAQTVRSSAHCDIPVVDVVSL